MKPDRVLHCWAGVPRAGYDCPCKCEHHGCEECSRTCWYGYVPDYEDICLLPAGHSGEHVGTSPKDITVRFGR